jgi:hypothetical protein
MRAPIAAVALAAAVVFATDARADGTEADAPVADLDALLARCATVPGIYARFTEERQIALLAVPLRSDGTLHFARGRGLVRHTLRSARASQSVLVTDKELVVWDGRSTRRLRLGSDGAVDAFVQSFSFVLAGNRPALEKSYALAFRAGNAGGWTLSLAPTGAELKKVITTIELSGRGLTIGTLRVREANGDVSTTRFTDVDVQKRYGDEEADRIFKVPPAQP